MSTVFDRDHVSPGATNPAIGSGDSNPLAILVSEGAVLDPTLAIPVPAMKQEEEKEPLTRWVDMPIKELSVRVTKMLQEFVQKDLPLLLPAIIRGVVEKEAAVRQAFCAAVVAEIIAMNEINLENDRSSVSIQLFTDDNSCLQGELLEYDEAGGVCVMDAEGKRSKATFTFNIPLRDIRCISLFAKEEVAKRAWQFISENLTKQFAKQEREKSVHNRLKSLLELMEADRRGGNKGTPVRFQLKGGQNLEGVLVAIDRCGCLVSSREEDGLEGMEDFFFIPLESIVMHGVLSDHYDELEIAEAQKKGKPVPARIQRKRDQRRQSQLDMGHDEKYLPKA